jgi:hypothetical protein
MAQYEDLDEVLKKMPSKFKFVKKFFFWDSLTYLPTGEKLIEGFRYFNCSIDTLMQAFSADDFAAIAKLPFALDEKGEIDTSSVCLLVSYTPSGSFFASQPHEYRDDEPVNMAAPRMFEGEAAKGFLALAKSLDQSS